MYNHLEIQSIARPRLMAAKEISLKCEPVGDDYARDLDDDTISYVLAAQKAFSKLRQAISQIAGSLVLDAASDRGSGLSEEGYRLAQASMSEVADLFASAEPTQRASHHHHHMRLAIEVVAEALASRRYSAGLLRGLQSERDILPLLKAAWTELASANRALPGFEMVDFGQACCAFHQTKSF